MRPRNVLTETNNMRKLMGLPLLTEDSGGSTIKDIKKKVLTEDRAFSLGFGNQGGLTFTEEVINENPKVEFLAVKRADGKYEIHMKYPGSTGEYKEFKLPTEGTMWTNDGKGYNSEGEVQAKIVELEKSGKAQQGTGIFTETTEAQARQDKGDGAPENDVVEEDYDVEYQDDNWLVLHDDDEDDEDDEPINEIEKAQKMAEERELKAKRKKGGMEEQLEDYGEGPLGMGGDGKFDVRGASDTGGGLEPLDQVVAEGDSFSKYNITLHDKETKQNINEGWFDSGEKKKDELEGYEPLTGLAQLKDETRRIISFLTPNEGDEIEGKYMENIYPAMALKVAESLYKKIEKMM